MSVKSDLQGFDLSKKAAAVIGCGGLGCNICVHLAGAGIGKILIADFDTVSLRNLNRQFIYKPSDLGKLKVEIMGEYLRRYAPDCDIISFNKKIEAPSDLDFTSECDIIFLAVDNNSARRIVNDYCTKKNIPLVNGGINLFSGTAYLYLPSVTPSLEDAGLLEGESKKLRPVSSTAGIIGSLEADIGIRFLLGEYEPGSIHIYDRGEIELLSLK